jgi:hypothetical protein
LRPHGRVVFSVPQPVTDTPLREWLHRDDGEKRALAIDGYFEAPTTLLAWDMKRIPQPFHTVQYRHTLEGWSRLVEDAGLYIARLREPCPGAEAIAKRPELAGAARVPYFLIFELREMPATAPAASR